MHPPNIDEVLNLPLLAQALDLLAAPAETQRAMIPPEREPQEELAALFLDALDRVRPVFWPAFPEVLRAGLEAIEGMLRARAEDGMGPPLRATAARARARLPLAPSAPRPWLDQMVRHEGRLKLRRQLLGTAPFRS